METISRFHMEVDGILAALNKERRPARDDAIPSSLRLFVISFLLNYLGHHSIYSNYDIGKEASKDRAKGGHKSRTGQQHELDYSTPSLVQFYLREIPNCPTTSHSSAL